MIRPCPVCTHLVSTALHVQNYCLDSGSKLPSKTRLVACENCGFVFVQSDANPGDYRDYYASGTKYESSNHASGSGEYALDKIRIEKLIDDLAAFLGPGSKILDIGAAKGGVLAELKHRGFGQLYGVDPSAACVESILEKGIPACIGHLEDEHWEANPTGFDLIILSHVMEHVYDMKECLELAVRRLTTTGEIYIEVPDADRYSMQGYPPFYFFDPEHINHCDLSALKRLGENVGLELVRSKTRDLGVGASATYPAIGGWFKQNDKEPDHKTDIDTRHKISAYTESCRQSLNQLPANKRLLQLVSEKTPVILWGAGSHARRMLANSALADTHLIGIIDNDPGKQGKSLSEVMIYSQQVGMDLANKNRATIIVAIAINPEAVVTELQLEASQLEVLSI